jgi:hypothetical protein
MCDFGIKNDVLSDKEIKEIKRTFIWRTSEEFIEKFNERINTKSF